MKNSVYIWFSGATDVTGKKLMEVVGIGGGNTKPPAGKRVVIGWGTKNKEKVTFPASVTVLNHPNVVLANRNKALSLDILEKAGVAVKEFVMAKDVKAAIADQHNPITFPLVGRTNYHQSGKGFHLCLTLSHVDAAIKAGAQYFQNYIDIKDEYRLHVFDGELIYAQKKVPRENMAAAFTEQQTEKVKAAAAKKKTDLDQKTLDFALGHLAKRQETPNQIVRSNLQGWKFARLDAKSVNAGMLSEAKKALKAAGMDFGAVDCCIDASGKAWIIEINSGPGLAESSLDAYVAAFKKKLAAILNPKPAKAEATKPAAKTTAKAAKTTAKAAAATTGGSSVSKEKLQSTLSTLQEMLAVADEGETAAVQSMARKMFGG